MVRMQQIHLGVSSRGYKAIEANGTEHSLYSQQDEKHEALLLSKCSAEIWPFKSYSLGCSRPILIGKHHQSQAQKLHHALKTAITDIISRWWKDEEAKFSSRMPLDREEEDLLKWIELQEEQGNLPKYPTRLGSWRPDFLIEDCQSTGGGERFRITEINARFCFNGLMHACYGQQALDDLGMEGSGLMGAADGTEASRTMSIAHQHLASTHEHLNSNQWQFLDGVLELFSPHLPLHLVKGEEQGIDISMFIHAVQARLGLTPRLITPAHLRLVADEHEASGFKLCCLVEANSASSAAGFLSPDGEVVEQIHQVGLVLFQHELAQLGREMRRQLSLRCFNDMRTVLLVHDKRMLGIVKQELQWLVQHNVLSPSQAAILDEGLADTILPGSSQLHQLQRLTPAAKHDYILKPVRSGKGMGIVFGEDLSDAQWMAQLSRLGSADSVFSQGLLLQRRITQQLYTVLLPGWGQVRQYALVGTYHVVNGRFVGIGIWRTNGRRICAVSDGAAWLCSVMACPDKTARGV
ncbi:hypothetical protein CDD82_7934 [Ophiocordyceps australis]|uniref:Glutathionylspermidine synthase pre-ATP-grasp-like domain-containing protein n=1 Tax=Ophiocordyceps australis TaxID=1399860 RepID=A0A2C5ZQR6_9HYPO|nr:hypothetical protein CDD82_7934 [Ophiocordyceps australis]